MPRLPIGLVLATSLCCTIFVCTMFVLGCSEGPPERIVLIVVDTLRRDHLSPYGARVATPNAQRLADRGQVFANAVSSFHQTTMSMAALFTGRTPSIESLDPKQPLPWTSANWCGLARFSDPGGDSCVPASLPTLAEHLQQGGFATAAVVTNQLLFRPAGYDRGFDEWAEIGGAPGDNLNRDREELARQRNADKVEELVAKTLDALGDKRAFLYIHYVDVHDWGFFAGKTYAESVVELDTALGRLVTLLEQRGWGEATLVLTSDHGESLDEEHALGTSKSHNGNPSYETLLRVPLIVSPARFEDTERLVRSQDIPSLIAQIAGLPALPDYDLTPDEMLLTEMKFVTYRRGRWKSTFHRKTLERWAVFDLATDPDEKVNRIRENPEIMREHLDRIGELAKALATANNREATLSESDRDRLRALGYIE